MSRLDPAVVGAIARDEVLSFLSSPKVREAGRVQGVGDGIATVIGLTSVMSGELVRFDNGVMGIAMNLDEESVSVVLLGPDAGIREGDFVERTGDVAGMPVGDCMLGRVVNALGEPIDQKGAIFTSERRPVERVAHGVLARKSVDVPLLTGIKAIDSMVPVGRGQRQLIIGDRQTGKTAIAIDTILRQKDTGVICVYVAIGQKNSTVAGIISTLSERDAMSYTAVVVAGASEPAPLQYMAPYSGCALAEFWMETGRDVLIIYDDLSKHAVAYRAMSLLMRRPPGREAYPGDVFYLHSRLLERAGRVTEKYGGGSITAFPIIETQGGDMSAYIPTNVISITDGQIYLESESFNAGIRPAVNPGLSVSRVGGAAQTKTMKKIAAPIRTELAQYRELASFAQFSSDMDEDTRHRLDHGERIVEILKQGQYKPYPLSHELLVLLAVTRGYFADIHIEHINEYEQDMLTYFQNNLSSLLDELGDSDGLDGKLEQSLIDGIEAFKRDYTEKHRPAKGR